MENGQKGVYLKKNQKKSIEKESRNPSMYIYVRDKTFMTYYDQCFS